ncbi:MAG TPA: hypothetical protein VEY33_04815 [Gemmatimonadota bacterium]|nr:hypothetical protein [Gemmatimonadota bacterium]
MWKIGFWTWVAISAMSCASAGGGAVGAVNLAPPQPAHGDDQAIAWPFTVVHGGEAETLADFHLRIEDGGVLLGVRPDRENPDTGARFQWRGELRSGEAYWIGDPLIPGDGVTLTLLVRPDPGVEPRLRVVHWPTDGRDKPVGPETCEVWRYETGNRKVSTEAC